MKNAVAFSILAIAVLIFGCTLPWDNPPATPTPEPTITPGETPNGVDGRCPASCDDGNPCTVDICGPVTDFMCENVELFGSQPSCTGAESTCKEWSCVNKACVQIDIRPCCGNGICEPNEDCLSCPEDCDCMAGELCCEGACKVPECRTDAECISERPSTCMVIRCTDAGTCDAKCAYAQRECRNMDGCCPDGCDYMNDNDCPAYGKGNTARASNNITVKVESLGRRICYLGPGREQQWYSARLVIANIYPEGTQYISPYNFTLFDPELGRTLRVSTPPGDCYMSDGPLLLSSETALNYQMGEITKVIYFYPEGKPILQGSKRLIFAPLDGERYIWLLSPQ